MRRIMTKFVRLSFAYSLFTMGVCIFWSLAHFAYFGYKWFASYTIATQTHSSFLDIRRNRLAEGKILKFRAIKADPNKSVYFGHIWIVWQDSPPLADGAISSGYYPADKTMAFQSLVSSFFSPISWLEGQKSVKGEMKDDTNLKYDWEMAVRIDDDAYWRASLIDNYWRVQNLYSLRPRLGSKTNNCRDYAFQIAEAIGLKTDAYNWAEFPPETFVRFLKSNIDNYGVRYSGGQSL